jgi:hypothetical protein
MRHCSSNRIALHKIDMIMALSVDVPKQAGGISVILSDDQALIEGWTTFSGVTPISPPMHKDSA